MPREADGASWQQVLDFIAEDGFGEHRTVEEFVADVVVGAGITPKAHHRGGQRRVLHLAGDELAGDPRAAAGPGALLACCQGGDAAGQDLAVGAEDGPEGGEGEAVGWRLDVPPASRSGTTAPTASRACSAHWRTWGWGARPVAATQSAPVMTSSA